MLAWYIGLEIALWLKIAMPIFILSLITFISIFGNVVIRFGKRHFILGGRRKRSCRDCIMLLMGKRTEFEGKYNAIKSDILRDQMNFAEHKIQEVQYSLLDSYKKDIDYFKNQKNFSDIQEENKQYLLYQECISNALLYAKDELRRSFKENGFHKMDSNDLKDYLRTKTQTLISIVRDYLRRNYPYHGMVVPLEERFKKVDQSQIHKINDIIEDIYINARSVRTKIEKKLVELNKNFSTDIDNLIQEK